MRDVEEHMIYRPRLMMLKSTLQLFVPVAFVYDEGACMMCTNPRWRQLTLFSYRPDVFMMGPHPFYISFFLFHNFKCKPHSPPPHPHHRVC
jgi:hypothetical protein